MADFRAMFVNVDGITESDLGIQDLKAATLEEARKEAPACTRPVGTNMIAICRDGQRVELLGVEPEAERLPMSEASR